MKHNRSITLFFILLFPLMLVAKVKQEVWVIDAGHGGHDVGCEGSRAKEKDINLKVALRVAELVRSNIKGVKVLMTRDSDRFISLEQRTSIANRAGASLFLSIHVNAVPENNKLRGTETYYGPLGATSVAALEKARKQNIQRSELLAWEMQKYYGLMGRPISRGVKRERYYVILHTLMPSILTEIGFITTPSEQEYMTSAKGQEEIAQSIYRGLLEYQQTIKSGKEKRMLAEMRRTGGRSAGQVMAPTSTPLKGEDVLLAQNTNTANLKSSTKAVKPVVKTDEVQGSARVQTEQVFDPVITHADSLAEAAVVLDSTLEPEYENTELIFAIQVFALKTRLKENDQRLKGLESLRIIETDGKFKYLCHHTGDYIEARRQLKSVREQYPDAFLVAFLGQRQISTANAQEMVKKK